MPASPSSDPELQEFELLYQQLLQEAFGTAVVAAADLLPLDEQLIRNAEHGDVPHRGAMHHIAPVVLDPTEEAVIRAGTQRPTGVARLPLLAGVILAPLLGTWLLLGMLFPAAPAPVRPTATPAGTPAPDLLSTATPFPTATPLPVPTAATGFVTVAGQPLPEVRPTTLDVGGRVFLVYVAPVQDGNWLVRPDPSVANWLPGATANWAFALFVDGGAPADAAWLTRLQPGTRVTLRVSSDSRPHLFRLQRRQEIARTQTEFLDPHRPGLTIALKTSAGAGDTRLLLQGTEEIPAQANASPVTEGR
jgi:hypothetical protein